MNHKFTVKCNNVIIGETDLEFADEHMGMHFGKFFPSEEYVKFQDSFRVAYEKKKWDDFNFVITSNLTKNKINFNFVWVQDLPEFPDEVEITVNVNAGENI